MMRKPDRVGIDAEIEIESERTSLTCGNELGPATFDYRCLSTIRTELSKLPGAGASIVDAWTWSWASMHAQLSGLVPAPASLNVNNLVIIANYFIST